ncbi:MAG: ribonuclease P protein component [Bacteroidetes bacterium]|nr:MAG: ribonuclease P protein component [Bacteroidota bacterium]
MSEFRFRRGERLKSHQEISRLFGRGSQSIGKYPLRLVWREMSKRRSLYPVQFALSVPKKRFKRAVVRNRLRRRIREAWRLHKHELYARLPDDAPQLAWMVIYVGREEHDYDRIARSMRKLITQFSESYQAGSTSFK